MGNLQAAINAGQAAGKLALYFGCWERAGHFLHLPNGRTIYGEERQVPEIPWSVGLMDGGLLKNGKRPDVYDGKVFWTCGGLQFWYAFYWWDNSVDRRGASNSGFYVRGFGWPEAQSAFDYACAEFPKVVSRQTHALILQNATPPTSRDAQTGMN
ncbi:hypothetical protein EN851_07855 [Mesorhizobium sp. M8A.F.Ca.ET.208.01.1.1]|uniref:hypothetical protein n=1 Tax=unclassified Mesorhizobium TaxID=325217 RepID=UPI001093B116|nr:MULTISPECIES: hypothetical protein [unclassified Mesorhizobium]TGQ95423.1 hypothetical protein EN851_07855 [Mesorhizobium sp. M8A.F.Ca.ET.208.01.1.1]TGT55914.1 hypothetical protein EN810_07855 [Mesorhizobium sp. M8A.F.Ca.ET.167.01.1.1]